MQRLGGRLQNDEPLVVIDYAHTPDALEKTLEALRPMATRAAVELICMFGCGGDRDATKRPLMGAIAEKIADGVVVTSDNPRSEDPQSIIEQIAAGMKDASKARRSKTARARSCKRSAAQRAKTSSCWPARGTKQHRKSWARNALSPIRITLASRWPRARRKHAEVANEHVLAA